MTGKRNAYLFISIDYRTSNPLFEKSKRSKLSLKRKTTSISSFVIKKKKDTYFLISIDYYISHLRNPNDPNYHWKERKTSISSFLSITKFQNLHLRNPNYHRKKESHLYSFVSSLFQT